MIDEVIGLMEVRPRDRVLNLSVGDGTAARRLARLAYEGLVVGVDPSEDTVRLARSLSVEIHNLMFVIGSPEEIPWQEDFFSAVLSAGLALDRARAAREIFRVVAPGGRVFVLEPPGGAEELFREAGFDRIEIRRSPAVVLEAAKAG